MDISPNGFKKKSYLHIKSTNYKFKKEQDENNIREIFQIMEPILKKKGCSDKISIKIVLAPKIATHKTTRSDLVFSGSKFNQRYLNRLGRCLLTLSVFQFCPGFPTS